MEFGEIQAAIEKLPEDQQRELAQWLKARARPKPAVIDQRVFFKSPALLWSIASLLFFLAVEGAVFRSGWYNKYLDPDSSTGSVESYVYWLRRTPPAHVPEVMLLGDSRIAEGFSSRAADALTGNRVHFWNFGMGGTTPRVWYYVLRDADPTRRRFQAIVIALDRYADEDSWDSSPNRIIDLNFAIGRLRLEDCIDFARSMNTRAFQSRALTGCLFKGITLRRDVQEFLRNIPARLKHSRDWRNNGLGYVSGYLGFQEDLSGLSADFARRTIHFPPGLSRQRQDSVQARLLPDPTPQTGEMTRYRELWLGRIIDLYNDSPTRIIFLEVPRGPLPIPESPAPATFLEAALKRPRVSALPSSTFRDLEKPELFFDGLHLNGTGRKLFSAKIAEIVPPLIGRQAN
jgi:hypothetical protein